MQQQIKLYHHKLKSKQHRSQRQEIISSIDPLIQHKMISFWRECICQTKIDLAETNHLVKQILVHTKKKEELFDISKKEIQAIGTYIDVHHQLDDISKIIDILYLERGVALLATSQPLFKSLVTNFQFSSTQQIRNILVDNMVEMMMDNKDLLKHANMPYYFLEYYLHLINMETDKHKMKDWFRCIKCFYERPKAEEWLFFENDFRILVDVLVRNIENFSTQDGLELYLETYLVLSLTKAIHRNNEYYKLQDVILILNQTFTDKAHLKSLIDEIKSLQKQ